MNKRNLIIDSYYQSSIILYGNGLIQYYYESSSINMYKPLIPNAP